MCDYIQRYVNMHSITGKVRASAAGSPAEMRYIRIHRPEWHDFPVGIEVIIITRAEWEKHLAEGRI